MTEETLRLARLSYHLEKETTEEAKALVMEILNETWEAIPSGARASIIRHWSSKPATIEFWDHPIADRPTIGGQARDRGRLVILRHDYLLSMSRNLARALVAHEFAHVFILSSLEELWHFKATIERDHRCTIDFNGSWECLALDRDTADSDFRLVDGQVLVIKESYNNRLHEDRARQINREWGFDEDALSEE